MGFVCRLSRVMCAAASQLRLRPLAAKCTAFTGLCITGMQALVSGNTHYDAGRYIPDPPFASVGPIPDCTTSLFLRDGCLDFVYAPATNRTVTVTLGASDRAPCCVG